jgi:arylformamidase
MAMSQWIDVTRPIDESLITWPGRSRPEHSWNRRIADGGHCNASSWQMSAHSGTHMDAPLHFVDGATPIDKIAPEVFMGPCQVVDLTSEPTPMLDDEMARKYAGAQRLLVKTPHSRLDPKGAYDAHEPMMTERAAGILLDAGLILIGTDRLSVDDSRGEKFALHHALLGAGCVIIEGLLLTDVTAGSYYLSAAPLRLTGTEASPVRAFLSNRTGV